MVSEERHGTNSSDVRKAFPITVALMIYDWKVAWMKIFRKTTVQEGSFKKPAPVFSISTTRRNHWIQLLLFAPIPVHWSRITVVYIERGKAMMTPPHVIKQAFFKRKVPWFSAQIEDVPIPIHSATGTGFNAKKRRLLRISDNFIITKVIVLVRYWFLEGSK